MGRPTDTGEGGLPATGRGWAVIDLYFTRIAGLTFAAHVFAVVALLLTPMTPRELSARFGLGAVSVLLRWPPSALAVQPTAPLLAGRPAAGAGGVLSASGAAPRLGRRSVRVPDDVELLSDGARRRGPLDEEVARTAGMLGVLGSLADRGGGGVLTSGLGESIDRAAGRLSRPRFAGETGMSGLGSRTAGPEGGCPLVDVGGIGAFGLTDDPEEARLTSLPRARLGDGTAPEIGAPCVSEAAVGHTLRRLRNPVRSCYERQLRLAPELRGELRVRFVIDGTGEVIDAHVADNTLGNQSIESCVLDVLESRTFPPCAGGGVAQVTYRWRFEPMRSQAKPNG